METKEMTIVESLLEDIRYISNRLESLSDRLDVKINGNHPISEEIGNVSGISSGIIDKLQVIKKILGDTEKSLEEQIGKL